MESVHLALMRALMYILSLKQFDIVYPAAGDDHSAVKLTIAELEDASQAKGWVDVCKEAENV